MKITDPNQIKEGDVFDFFYHVLPHNHPWKNSDRYWCFDGQLVAKKDRHGNLFLEDTYWGSGENRTFKLGEVLKEGDLTFRFNLQEVEEAKLDIINYYHDEDCFDFSSQKGCYPKWVLRKGAQRNKEKMLKTLNNKIYHFHSQVKLSSNNVEYYSILKGKVESGNLDVCI